ncbi:hypothetical protein PC116_g30511 [Phytophthora cactorum]|nr:hypothetical protein PC116_g30511 [Phytophthora cactorum]
MRCESIPFLNARAEKSIANKGQDAALGRQAAGCAGAAELIKSVEVNTG